MAKISTIIHLLSLNRVGYDFDKETVKVLGVKWNVCETLFTNLRRLSSSSFFFFFFFFFLKMLLVNIIPTM